MPQRLCTNAAMPATTPPPLTPLPPLAPTPTPPTVLPVPPPVALPVAPKPPPMEPFAERHDDPAQAEELERQQDA